MTDLSIVSWVDACNCKVYLALFEKFAEMVVPSPESLGLASIFYNKMVNSWEMFQIMWIFGVFPLLVISNAGLWVDCPDFLGYLPVRVEKTWIRLATITLWSNMPKIQVSASMLEWFQRWFLIWQPSVGTFPCYMLITVSGKDGKIK